MSTAGSVVSSSAPAAPASTTTLSTPGGRPATSAAEPKISDEIGVSGLGRRMTELPAISAGISFWNAMMIAPLYGVMAATTPIGSWRRMLNATRPWTSSSTGTGFASSCVIDRNRSMVPRARVTPMFSWANSANIFGWPASAIIVSTSAEPFASMWSTNVWRIRARSVAAIDAHCPSSNARRASAIARPNSATGVTETSVKCDSSAGFSTGSDSSPSTQRPAT